jgi:hypothetical protein
VLTSSSLSAGAAWGGTGTVPSFICTSILNFTSIEKEFYKSLILKWVLDSKKCPKNLTTLRNFTPATPVPLNSRRMKKSLNTGRLWRDGFYLSISITVLCKLYNFKRNTTEPKFR